MITERTEVSAQASCATDAPSRVGAPPWLLWGGMIGLAQIFAIATVQPLGVSTAYPQLVGYLVDKIAPGFAESQPYLQKIGAKIGWEVMLIIGIALGALLSRLLPGGDRTVACALPTVFRASWARGLAAFVGGFETLRLPYLPTALAVAAMLGGIVVWLNRLEAKARA